MSFTMDEVKQLTGLGWPRTLTNLFNFAPRLVILAALGHLPNGATLVAGGGLGMMTANIIGNMLMRSSSFGIGGLFAQAYGAENLKRCGQLLQRALLLHWLLIACVTLPLTIFSKQILVACGQPPIVAEYAQAFLWVRLAALPFFTFTSDATMFLTGQKCVKTPAMANLAGAGCQILLCYVLTAHFGFIGAPLSMTIVEVSIALFLFFFSPHMLAKHGLGASWPDWLDWSTATHGWDELIGLGSQAAVLIISEWFGWECMLLIAGGLCAGSDTCAPVEAMPIAAMLMVCQYVSTSGPGMAANVRVGNLLGEGNAQAAWDSAKVGLYMSVVLAGSAAAALMATRFTIADMMVDDPALSERIGRLMGVTVVYGIFATLSAGWTQQCLFGMGANLRVPAMINFGSFYFVGIPVGGYLGFQRGWEEMGLWTGLVVANVLITIGQGYYLIFVIDWPEAARVARAKALEVQAAAAKTKSTSGANALV